MDLEDITIDLLEVDEEEADREIQREEDKLYLTTNKPTNFMIIPQVDWYNITRDLKIDCIGDPEHFRFPEHENIYKLRSFKTVLNDNGKSVDLWHDVIEFKSLRLGFIKEKERVILTTYWNDITSKEFYSSVLFLIKNKVNELYFYILFRILYHVPDLLFNTLNRYVQSYLKLEKNLYGELDGKIVDINNTYDIQITSIDFTNYTIRGIRNNIEKKIYVPFYFRVIKSDNNKFYIFTNLYNEENIMEQYGIKPLKLLENKIPDYQELYFDTKGSQDKKYLPKFDVTFKDVLNKEINKKGMHLIYNIDITMELKFIITIPRIESDNISSDLKKKYLNKNESLQFFNYMTYVLMDDLDMPTMDDSSVSIGTIYPLK